MLDIIEKFLVYEISSQELYESIYSFITNPHIRSGEFEANEFIIKKLDRINFIIFPEYTDPDGRNRDIPRATSVYKKDLIIAINREAVNKGLKSYDFSEEDENWEW